MDGSSPPAPPMPESARVFSLQTIFLVMTLISAWLALTVNLPWLGLVLAILGVPAFFRAAACRRRSRLVEIPWGPTEAVGAFFRSLMLMWAIAVMGFVLFMSLAILCVMFLNLLIDVDVAIPFGVALAGIAILIVAIKAIHATWPGLRGDDRPYS